MTNGQRIVTTAFVVMYLVPMAGLAVLGNRVYPYWKVSPLSPMTVTGLAATYGLFLFLCATKISVLPALPRGFLGLLAVKLGGVYRRWRLLFGLLGVLLGVAMIVSGASTFRVLHEGLTEQDPTIIALSTMSMVWTTVGLVDLIYYLFVRANRRRELATVLMATGLLLQANGIHSALVGFLALWHALSPRAVQNLVFRGTRDSRIGVGVIFVGVIGLAAMLAGAWYVGNLIKLSRQTGDFLDVISEGVFEKTVPREYAESLFWAYCLSLLDRLSVHYYAWTFTAGFSWDGLTAGWSALAVHLENFLFRLDYLLGGAFGITHPEGATLNRLNYELLTVDQIIPRTGASPGLLGSFNYVCPFPLNVLLCALYLRWVCRRLDTVIGAQGVKWLTPMGSLFGFLLLQSLFQAPLDAVMVFDQTFMFLVLLWALAIAHQKPTRAVVAGRAGPPAPIHAGGVVRVNPV